MVLYYNDTRVTHVTAVTLVSKTLSCACTCIMFRQRTVTTVTYYSTSIFLRTYIPVDIIILTATFTEDSVMSFGCSQNEERRQFISENLVWEVIAQ